MLFHPLALISNHGNKGAMRPPGDDMNKLFLHLWHGRDSVNQDMDDWGFDGPEIGPLIKVGASYMSGLVLEFEDAETRERFFPRVDADPMAWLEGEEDCIEYEGKFYGEWTAFMKEVGDEDR